MVDGDRNQAGHYQRTAPHQQTMSHLKATTASSQHSVALHRDHAVRKCRTYQDWLGDFSLHTVV
jgi:hypothetical protein